MSTLDPIYKKLAVKMNAPQNRPLPKLLSKIADPEQARIANELPGNAENIAKRLGLTKTKVEKQLQYLFERGLVMKGKTGWVMVNNIFIFKDQIASANEKYIDDELLDLAWEMGVYDDKHLAQRIKKGEKIPPLMKMAVIVPKWRTIKDIPGILPCEDVREILKSASLIALHDCPCRKVYRKRSCKDEVPLKTCLHMNTMGQHFIDNGTAKKITYDEAIALLDEIDKFGLVNTAVNSTGQPQGLCSCCPDCCTAFVSASYTKPALGDVPYIKSRFVVEDDPKKCIGCGICIEKCPVNAITMKELKSGKKHVSINVEECIGCGVCVLACPKNANKMKLVRPPEYILNAQMDIDFEKVFSAEGFNPGEIV